jgi:carbon dioxide concentrating mechanism protein CcmN
MSVSLLRLGDRFDAHIHGDVIIHPSAVLAPGVILQAATNSTIVIGAGVCLGMGSILQVSEGILEIEAGANLGAGFLMVGEGKIGANACIGAATTVFNCSVAPGQVIPSGSILGDTSRQIVEPSAVQPQKSAESAAKLDSPHSQPEKPEEQEKVFSSTQRSVAAFLEFKHQSTPVSPSSPTPKSQSPPEPETAVVGDSTSVETPLPESTETTSEDLKPSESDLETHNIFGTQIYGQGSINRLLTTLFPHRQSLGNENSHNSSG